MARYVVLKFADNDGAARFIDQVTMMGKDTLTTDKEVFSGTEVTALIYAPTLFCEEPMGQHGQKKAGWTLGQKYGWWIDTVCGRPSKAWGSNFRAVISSAKNILEEEANVRQTPEPS